MARRARDDLDAARAFCLAFEAGLIEGVTADGVLLDLWVGPGLATEMLTDEDATRKVVLNLRNGWKAVSYSTSVVVTINWDNVEIAKGDTTVLRGDVVTLWE